MEIIGEEAEEEEEATDEPESGLCRNPSKGIRRLTLGVDSETGLTPKSKGGVVGVLAEGEREGDLFFLLLFLLLRLLDKEVTSFMVRFRRERESLACVCVPVYVKKFWKPVPWYYESSITNIIVFSGFRGRDVQEPKRSPVVGLGVCRNRGCHRRGVVS